MLKRNFGTTSLQVSALGFGAGHIGSDGVTERHAHARGPLLAAERAGWEKAFAPHAGEWAGEV